MIRTEIVWTWINYNYNNCRIHYTQTSTYYVATFSGRVKCKVFTENEPWLQFIIIYTYNLKILRESPQSLKR